MICLLCYASNDECISVDSEQGRQLKVSILLFKYFQFCFDFEPTDGDICSKCWHKTLAFHEFYIQIESIHEVFNKSKDAHDRPHDTVKVEVEVDVVESNTKCDEMFNDNWSFHSDPDALSTHSSLDFPSEDVLQPNEADNKALVQQVVKVKTEANIEKIAKNQSNKKGSKKTSKTKKKRKKIRGRPKQSSQFTCKIRMCHEEFDTMEALVSHKTAAHRRIQCTHCPDLKLVVDLNKHLRTTHGIEQNSMCEHCGQVYMNTRSLQDHIQRKHEISEPLQCDICKEWFKSRDTIRAHMNYVHVQGPQACPICGKISANRKALRKHQTIHLEAWKDRFKCIICGRGFRDSTKLKEHSYIHSGITDAYICQFCGQSFRFGSSLSAHRMRYHPAEMAHVKDRLQRKKNLEFKV